MGKSAIEHRLLAVIRDTSGAAAAEYVLILGVLGVALAIGAISLGSDISNSMNATSQNIRSCAGLC